MIRRVPRQVLELRQALTEAVCGNLCVEVALEMLQPDELGKYATGRSWGSGSDIQRWKHAVYAEARRRTTAQLGLFDSVEFYSWRDGKPDPRGEGGVSL